MMLADKQKTGEYSEISTADLAACIHINLQAHIRTSGQTLHQLLPPHSRQQDVDCESKPYFLVGAMACSADQPAMSAYIG
jgi:hypothetical protein